jgi:hypothetical protein
VTNQYSSNLLLIISLPLSREVWELPTRLCYKEEVPLDFRHTKDLQCSMLG